jgi:hypothetical protein
MYGIVGVDSHGMMWLKLEFIIFGKLLKNLILHSGIIIFIPSPIASPSHWLFLSFAFRYFVKKTLLRLAYKFCILKSLVIITSRQTIFFIILINRILV